MLVLSRKLSECFLIGDDIIVRVAGIAPHVVDLAITAPPSLRRLLLPNETAVPADQEVISRGHNESLRLGDDITVIVVDIRRDKVRLGVDYPEDHLEVRRMD
jgi:sRNA-binding carbon storage regulator CsrA